MGWPCANGNPNVDILNEYDISEDNPNHFYVAIVKKYGPTGNRIHDLPLWESVLTIRPPVHFRLSP